MPRPGHSGVLSPVGSTVAGMDIERVPYVGQGADGCLRSAQIDREEADGLPTGPSQPGWSASAEQRRSDLLDSARRWEDQAAATTA
jgi:hypothetical protein